MADDIPWTADPSFRAARRAETAVVENYELVVIDMPPGPSMAGYITWELYGPPNTMRLIEWGECCTFEKAKCHAEEALRRALGMRDDELPE